MAAATAAARASARRRGRVGTKARVAFAAIAAVATMAMFITCASAFYLPGVAPQDFAMVSSEKISFSSIESCSDTREKERNKAGKKRRKERRRRERPNAFSPFRRALLSPTCSVPLSLSPSRPHSLAPPPTKTLQQGDPIPLKVNKLASVKTQLPFDFYSLPFCRPEKIVPSAENLGEVLRGDRIKNSAYEVAFKVDQACKVLCVKGPLTAEEAEQFSKAVRFFGVWTCRERRERETERRRRRRKNALTSFLCFSTLFKKNEHSD